MKHCLTTLLLLLPWLIWASPASAQTVGLSISPPVVEILLAPNKKVMETFTLKNLGESIEIVPTLHLALPQGVDGHVSVNPSPLSPASIPLIAKLSPFVFGQSIPFPAGSSLQLTLTLEGASTDYPQDTYLALVITPSSTVDRPGLTSATPAISALIFTTLTPISAIPASLQISNFDPPILHDTALPFTLQPHLTNQTDIMLHPRGQLTIINPRGTTVHQTELTDRLILKNSTRELELLTWSPRLSTIGPHRVNLSFSTLGGTKLIEVEKTVWFLPLRGIVGLILICLILGTLIIRRRH